MAKRLLVTSAGTGPSNNLIRSLRAGHPSVTIIGGQSLCLLLTLLVVPVAYSYFAEFQAVPWREWAGRALRGLRQASSSSDEV